MKRLLFAGALAFAAIGQALAADLPEPMPPPPPRAPAAYMPAVIAVYNWGGIYYGANGGYAFGNSQWTNPAIAANSNSSGTFSTTGFVVGPTLGVNVQTDALVFGLEGDFDGSWLDGKTTNTFCLVACETKNTWIATLRGRFGYAADRVLFYGTAGGAYGNIRSGINGFFDNSDKPGWVAGAGIEGAFTDNWTARVEYLFVQFSNATCNLSCPVNTTVKLDTSMIRLGLDYKFR
jgi:outer membrane immunogenic protein